MTFNKAHPLIPVGMLTLLLAFLWLADPVVLQAQEPVIEEGDLDLLEAEDDTPRLTTVELSEFETLVQQYLGGFTREYAERFPIVKKGEEIEIVQPTGIVVRGVYSGLVKGVVHLDQGETKKKIPATELRVQDRLGIDRAFREIWLDVLARSRARQEFTTQGIEFKTYDLALGNQFTEALAMSDARALYRKGKDYRGGIKLEKDFGYSFLYTSMAAKQGLVDAQYDFGRMFFSGVGTSPNKRVGLQWIAAAAAENHPEAQKFLTHHRISREAAQKAAEAHLEAEQAEQEAYEARIEHYQERNANKVIIRGRKSESPFD